MTADTSPQASKVKGPPKLTDPAQYPESGPSVEKTAKINPPIIKVPPEEKTLKTKNDRVIVFERKSGRCYTGNNAPLYANLRQWLTENPTFEAVEEGSTQAETVKMRLLSQIKTPENKTKVMTTPRMLVVKSQQDLPGSPKTTKLAPGTPSGVGASTMRPILPMTKQAAATLSGGPSSAKPQAITNHNVTVKKDTTRQTTLTGLTTNKVSELRVSIRKTFVVSILVHLDKHFR